MGGLQSEVCLRPSFRRCTHTVTVCGPRSMISDVSNAVTDVQKDILLRYATCNEMFLETDVFGW